MNDATPRLRNLLPAGAVAVLLAFLVYWPAVTSGGFLSDDPSIVGFLLDPQTNPPAVDWQKVALDFQRPWMNLREPQMYRPLVSVTFAIDYAIGGGAPWIFHFTNLLIHGLVSMFCGLLCGLCVPHDRWRRWATLLGGGLFAVHPIGHEAICWLAARNSGLEVLFRLMSMTAFALAMYRGTFWRHLGAVVCAVLALLTKETAIMLPACYLALDLLITPRRALAQRLLLHLSYAPLWVLYFLLRLATLGSFLGSVPAGGGAAGSLPLVMWQKLQTLLFPMGDSIPWLVSGWMALTLAWFLLLNLRSRAQLMLFAGGLAWIVLLYMPSHRLQIEQDLFCCRYVYGSFVAMCVVMMRLFFTGDEPFRHYRRIGLVALLVAAVGMVVADIRRLDKYRHCWEELAELHRQVDVAAADASVERPLVMLSAQGSGHPGVPFLHVHSMYPLGEQPFASADHPFVGLGCAIDFVAGVRQGDWDLNFDMAPVRALWRQGARISFWQPDRRAGRLVWAGRARPQSPPPMEREGGNRFLFRGPPLSAFQVEAVRVITEKDVGGGSLRWLTNPPASAGQVEFQGGEVATEHREHRVFHIDLSHHRRFLLDLTLLRAQQPDGSWGLTGFEVQLPRGKVVSLETVARLLELVLPRRLQGETVPLSGLGSHLVAPPLPDGADPAHVQMQLVLMSAMYPVAVRVEPGRPVRLSVRQSQHLADMCGITRVDRFYYYFATVRASLDHGSSLDHRSEVGWFLMDAGPPK